MITADLVLRRGNIMTFDPQRSRTSALAIGGERILALGEEAEALIGPQTNIIDLAGRAVIPGLFDSHIHTMMGGLNEIAVSLEGARSILTLESTRREKRGPVSNIRWSYGHGTIPRHLRDIVVTEYGVADLRGCALDERARRLMAIAAPQFRESLEKAWRCAGK